MKKLALVLAGQLLLGSVAAYAQTAAGGAGVSGSGYANPGIIVSPRPITQPYPVPVPPPSDSGFIQFNNLSVESVSALVPPAEILATNPYLQTYGGGPMPEQPRMMSGKSAAGASGATCYRFKSKSGIKGSATPCPTPPSSTATSSPATAVPTAPTSAAIANPPYFRYAPYRIEVDASTKLILRDRTPATLADFTGGDQINVFGYYNEDGSIQAHLVRNLSRPVEKQFIQLNNADLISISGTSLPATLIVVQRPNYPCYGYGSSGTTKDENFVCPMGLKALPNTSTNIPQSIMPIWNMVRKYQVTVDAATLIFDRNRTSLSPASLKPGDELNIYGDTSDNGQTIAADIVRDLSIPAQASNYTGTVTQVNADGSFVIQTNDGQTTTVKNPIQAGATVTLRGVLDAAQGILSQITQIFIGAFPTPMPMGGMPTIQMMKGDR